MKMFLNALLPLLTDLIEGRKVTEDHWGELSLPRELLEHNGVSFAQWRWIWEAAAREERLTLAPRQQLIWEAARSTLLHLPEIQQAVDLVTPDFLESVIQTQVMPCLPPGAAPSRDVRLVLGTCSGGFFIDSTTYLDLNALREMSHDSEAMRQFLAHELWHTAHARALEGHPQAEAPWFMVLASNQSEAMVNYLIGGTRELMERTARTGEGTAREQAELILAYVLGLRADFSDRMAELWDAIAGLMVGDSDRFRAYQATLPDMFGYLHGPLMAEQIDSTLGRQALLRTLTDPVAFFLAYHQAAETSGGCPMPEALSAKLEALLR